MRLVWQSFCALCILAAPAAAVEDRTIVYAIHEDPQDADSAVTFEVRLRLAADSVEKGPDGGGTVKWEVTRITLQEMDDGTPVRRWSEVLPHMDTRDFLWTIEHPDLQNIETSEFAEPPLLQGFAAPAGHAGSDLEFEFQGGMTTAPIYPATGWASYYFKETKVTEPAEEGDDEPVDVFEEEDDS